MLLHSYDHNTIKIVKVIFIKCLIRDSFFLICLKRTFKLRQILRDKIHYPLPEHPLARFFFSLKTID